MRDNLENVVRFLKEASNISLPERVRGPPQVLIQWVPGLVARREAGHSTSSSSEVKNVWSSNSIPHIRLQGMHGNNFSLTSAYVVSETYNRALYTERPLYGVRVNGNFIASRAFREPSIK
jgi:hypothetical protein